MSRLVRTLVDDEAGTTTIEYALIGTLVGVACIAAFQRFAAVTSVFYAIVSSLTSTAVS